MTTLETSLATPRKIANFTVLAKLGDGAASQIYAVQDAKSKQVWALKHVEKGDEKSQRFLDQVEKEYAIGSKLDHNRVRGVRKLLRHRKLFKIRAISLLMELVDAQTLDEQLPRSHGQAVEIFRQVAEGLAHMHAKGFVHADMKPNNVLITEEGDVKIIDLGQACTIGTVKKRIQGTPGYMAPEQAHRGQITPQTDIYNLGAMMYWVLVGECIPTTLPPKSARDGLLTGALDADKVALPVPPHERNPRIHGLLSKQILDCVQPMPEDRPASMDVVANRLELISEVLEQPISATPPLGADGETTAEFDLRSETP